MATGEHLVDGVVVPDDVVMGLNKDHAHVIILLPETVEDIVLVRLLKVGDVARLSHQRDTVRMEHGVLVRQAVVLEPKQDHELALIPILVAVVDVLVPERKQEHVDGLSHQQDGDHMEHGVHVQ